MGQRKYPPLTPREIVKILLARGFVFSHSKGDHKYYSRRVKGIPHLVQVDMGADMYDATWIKMILEESGLSRVQFYCSLKATAKKINKKQHSKDQLVDWAV